MSMLPRYLIGRAAADPHAAEGGPIFILDRDSPRLFIRFDPDVSLSDGADVLRQLDAGDPVTAGDGLMLRVWSPDGVFAFEAVADRLKAAAALYRAEVEPSPTGTELPARWGCLFHADLSPLLAGVRQLPHGVQSMVFDSAHRELPHVWSGVVLAGLNCLQFLEAQDPDSRTTTFRHDGYWPDMDPTPHGITTCQGWAAVAWAEHNAP